MQIDEVQNLAGDALSHLLTILGDVLEATTDAVDVTGQPVTSHLPVLVQLFGLPSFPERAAAAAATFSPRFATAYLEPFTDSEVQAVLTLEFADGYPVLSDDGPAEVYMGRGAIVRFYRSAPPCRHSSPAPPAPGPRWMLRRLTGRSRPPTDRQAVSTATHAAAPG
ncbi:hypothetical protein [Euzebya tangerina]|uniref:hypothetical protein n=1 Tax=Euzebya tangerina TaxID=591198 RepID=UPI000E31B0BB|nr:hypothetical protein [Euzebya tangerina]